MGKKKGGSEDSNVTFLGRPKNNVTIGIVGLPNVGKSSFFNLLCKQSVPAENFPFCKYRVLWNLRVHVLRKSEQKKKTAKQDSKFDSVRSKVLF